MQPDTTAMRTDPIFLVGAARSGTTLLQYVLRSHPELSFPTGESHFFVPFYQRRAELGDLSRRDTLRNVLAEIYHRHRKYFDEELHGIAFSVDAMTDFLHAQGCASIPEVITAMLTKNARLEGKVRWGDKTPYYVLHMDLLLEMFPKAQFVHIVRDGRDCALSMLARSKDLYIFNTYHAAYLWQRYVDHGTRFGRAHPERYLELRYEDLLGRPEESLTGLCAFLGVPYTPALLEFRKPKAAGKTRLLGQPLQAGNTGKWEARMTPRQVKVFEALAGAMLAEKGYPVRHAPPPRLGLLADRVYNAHIRVSSWTRDLLP